MLSLRSRLISLLVAAVAVVACGSDATVFDAAGGAAGSDGSAGNASSTSTAQGASGGAPGCMPGDTEPCYSGPPNTEGVGICMAGVRTCGADGRFGDCAGEVLPSADDCMTPEDEDCDGQPGPCPSGDHVWSKRYGGTSTQHFQQPTTIASDASSNVFVGGNFSGSIDIDGTIHNAQGVGTCAFIAKLDPNGTRLWSKAFCSDSSSVTLEAAATSATGQVVLAGYFQGSTNFGGATLQGAGEHDLFVAVLDGQGSHVWSKRYGDADYQQAQQVAVDASGNIVVAGYFQGTLAFEGLSILTAQPGHNRFVVKFSPTGTPQWVEHVAGTTELYTRDIAVDAAGNVFVGGVFAGAFDVGMGAVLSAGGYDAFLMKLSPSGSVIFATAYGDGAEQHIDDLAVDTNGNVSVTGRFYGTIDFGGGALSPQGLFVARLDPSGAHLFSTRFGNGLTVLGRSRIAVDGFQHFVVYGSYYDGTLDFGGGALPKGGDYDIYLGKLDPVGAHVWSKGFGDGSLQEGQRMALDPQGNTLVTGWFTGTVDFGGGPLTASGTNAFVAKFAL
jgi:hypothetical protein